jgi:hypothetical protein
LDPEKTKNWAINNGHSWPSKDILKIDKLRDLVYDDLMKLAN